MGKLLAVVLILAGVVAEVAFLATGAGRLPEPSPLADALGPAAGSLGLAVGGGLALVVGLLLLGRPRADGGEYALREVLLLLSVASGVAFAVALSLGVARGWRAPTLAALTLAGGAESLVGVALAVRVGLAAERRKALFVVGAAGSALLVLFYVALLALGSE